MNNNLELGVGPMSLEVIDAVIKYANTKDREIMLIASRNQIECAELGSGYVGGLDSKRFVEYVRGRDLGRKVLICRDHCGPGLHSDERGMEYEQAMERVMHSLYTDAMAGFDLIHVDTSGAPDPYKAAEKMFGLLNKLGKPLQYEFGTEDNVGTAVSAEKFERDVEFVKQFVSPRFVVGQTGSLVKSTHQVGHFDKGVVAKLVEIARRHNVKLKEHNADYITNAEVHQRVKQGVGAINVAPEFGVAQTAILVDLCKRWKLHDELNAFMKVVIDGGKWKKWKYGEIFSDKQKFMSAGHYHFMSPEYLDIVSKINLRDNFGAAVERKVFKLLDNYLL